MMRFSETRNYGINEIIKRYARFPWYLPLPAHFAHGWGPNVLKSDLATDKPLMLAFSKRIADDWKKKSSIPIGIMGAPFVHYKNLSKIRQRSDAKGTIVFPGHSSYDLESQFSPEQYCRELKNLPEQFQPITICLFWLDYLEETADIYRQHGFKVVTAGYKFSIGLNFAKNFYKILSRYKYATSNEVGSPAFYAVDFGLPFFLTGKKMPTFVNLGQDVNAGKTSRTDDFRFGVIAIKLFRTGPVTRISLKQKKFVTSELGSNDCLTRSQLHDLLVYHNKSFRSPAKTIKYLLESAFLRFILNGPWGRIIIRVRKKITRG